MWLWWKGARVSKWGARVSQTENGVTLAQFHPLLLSSHSCQFLRTKRYDLGAVFLIVISQIIVLFRSRNFVGFFLGWFLGSWGTLIFIVLVEKFYAVRVVINFDSLCIFSLGMILMGIYCMLYWMTWNFFWRCIWMYWVLMGCLCYTWLAFGIWFHLWSFFFCLTLCFLVLLI